MKFAKQTERLIEQYAKDGYEIHVGNNPRMDQAPKWQGHHLVRLAQTNSRYHGRSVRTVWAAKRKK